MSIDFPSAPIIGQKVSSGVSVWVWDGVAWNISNQVLPASVSDIPPSNPVIGQTWWRGTNGKTYIWTDDGTSQQWVEIGCSAQANTLWEPIPNAQGGLLHTFNAVANYDIKDLGAFHKFRFDGSFSNSASAFLGLQLSADNGVTWRTAANDYAYQRIVSSAAGSTPSSANLNTWPLTTSNDAGTNFRGTFEGTIEDFNKALLTSGLSSSGNYAVANMQATDYFVRLNNATGPFNALRFLVNSGTMTGSLTLEGVRG